MCPVGARKEASRLRNAIDTGNREDYRIENHGSFDVHPLHFESVRRGFEKNLRRIRIDASGSKSRQFFAQQSENEYGRRYFGVSAVV